MTATETDAGLVPLLDIDALAVNLCVTTSFVRRLIHERRIPFLKIGKFIRFHPTDIENWILDQRVEEFRRP